MSFHRIKHILAPHPAEGKKPKEKIVKTPKEHKAEGETAAKVR